MCGLGSSVVIVLIQLVNFKEPFLPTIILLHNEVFPLRKLQLFLHQVKKTKCPSFLCLYLLRTLRRVVSSFKTLEALNISCSSFCRRFLIIIFFFFLFPFPTPLFIMQPFIFICGGVTFPLKLFLGIGSIKDSPFDC